MLFLEKEGIHFFDYSMNFRTFSDESDKNIIKMLEKRKCEKERAVFVKNITTNVEIHKNDMRFMCK